MMKRTGMTAALVLGLTGGAAEALAHGVAKPAHGGQVVETSDGTRVELVIRQGGIGLWVRDHEDKPIPANRVSGKATLLVNGKKQDLSLKTEGDALAADGQILPSDKVTAIMTLTVDGQPESARFQTP